MVHRDSNRTSRMRRLISIVSFVFVVLVLPFGLGLARGLAPGESDPLRKAWIDLLSRYESYDDFLENATDEDREFFDAYMEHLEERLQRMTDTQPEPDTERILRDLSMKNLKPTSIGSIPMQARMNGPASFDAGPGMRTYSQPVVHHVFTEADYDITYSYSTGLLSGATAIVHLEDNMNRIGAWASSVGDAWAEVGAGNGVYFSYTVRVPLSDSLVVSAPGENKVELWSDPDGRYIYEVCYEYDLGRPGDAVTVAGTIHYGPDSGSNCVDVHGTSFYWGITRGYDSVHSQASLTLTSVVVEPDTEEPVQARIEMSGYYGVFLRAWYGGYTFFNLYLIVCKADHSQCWQDNIAYHIDFKPATLGDYYRNTFTSSVDFVLEPGVEYFAILYAQGHAYQEIFFPEVTLIESGYLAQDLYSQWYEISLAYYE